MKNKTKVKLSIQWKLLFVMVELVITLLVAITFIQISSQKKIFEKESRRHIEILKKSLIDRGKTLSDELVRMTENHIATYNLSNITLIINKAISKNEELIYAILMDTSRTTFIHSLHPEHEHETISEPEDLFASKQEEATINEYEKNGISYIEFIVPIQISIDPWGWLRLGFSQDILNREIMVSKMDIADQVKDMIVRSVLLAIAFIAAGSVVVVVVSRRFTKPLITLTNFAQKLAQGKFKGDEDIQFQSNDEIGVLTTAFVEMATNLEDYNKTMEQKVEQRTVELEKAYNDLRRSQKQLVQSEKMASLGQLVTGVAHEINTPLGIGVTASTHLIKITNKITDSLNNKTMTKSDLEKYFATSKKSSDLIYKNLARTAELIKSFKMVSADQASREKRKFKLKAYLDDIMTSLHPRLKRTKLDITINCDVAIELNSYPGFIAQIITNFIMNSIAHAFEINEKGSITIDVTTLFRKGFAVISYSDNGKGIEDENIAKIFDPFFTTKRGEGGTGLGLNIVYNIVTQTLKGKLLCKSIVGEGTTFVVEIPLIAQD